MSGHCNLEMKDNQLTITVNSKVYPLEAVYSAAYVFMDRAYIVLDGDPEKQILVKMTLKSKGSLEELGNEFNNELLNYADYLTRAKKTSKIRETILQRALITNDPSLIKRGGENYAPEELIDMDEDMEGDFMEDPEGIAIPWEEKYGDNDDGAKTKKNEDKNK